MITDDACWADFRVAADETKGRQGLFLDRDGVLIEDTGYPHRSENIVLLSETLSLVRAANQRGFVVGIVTNQSGIGRGLFDWPAFSSVQAVIDDALEAMGAHVDFVLACPYHADATVPRFRRGSHAWRKPAPGMINTAVQTLKLELRGSVMVGDRVSDMEAAQRAGVSHRILLSDSPAEPSAAKAWNTVPQSRLHDVFERLTRNETSWAGDAKLA